jgi:hypothetical protein
MLIVMLCNLIVTSSKVHCLKFLIHVCSHADIQFVAPLMALCLGGAGQLWVSLGTCVTVDPTCA